MRILGFTVMLFINSLVEEFSAEVNPIPFTYPFFLLKQNMGKLTCLYSHIRSLSTEHTGISPR